jgi:hypothetical protein
VHVDPIKPTLKAPVIKRLKLKCENCFQVLPSTSTCVATTSVPAELGALKALTRLDLYRNNGLGWGLGALPDAIQSLATENGGNCTIGTSSDLAYTWVYGRK